MLIVNCAALAHMLGCQAPGRRCEARPRCSHMIAVSPGHSRCWRRASASRSLADYAKPSPGSPKSASSRPARSPWTAPPVGGGFPRGHVTELIGGASSGKTALLYAALAALVDAEGTAAPDVLRACGIDLDTLVLARPVSATDALLVLPVILRLEPVGGGACSNQPLSSPSASSACLP
jgi:hypothetical protein